MKILALGAHYDDIEIGVGGTLLKHRLKNDKIFMGITSSDEFRTGDTKIRLEEQLDSLSILNIDCMMTFKESTDIFDVVGMLDQLNADIIYTMFEKDTHPAHRRCSHIGQSAGRKTQILFYNSGTAYDFFPNLFSIISFNFKQKLLECFRSQIELNSISISTIRKREAYWGSLISKSYAEGFVARKLIYE